MPKPRNCAVEHVETACKQEERAAGPQAAAGDHRRNKQIEHETYRREQVRRQSPTCQSFAEAQCGVLIRAPMSSEITRRCHQSAPASR